MAAAKEIFWAFFGLGWVSFGGPAAHIGYFRQAFVEQRQWLDDKQYAGLVALGQFLPGPASSQVGFAIGLQRAGLAGGIAAFVGFTLPSFLLMWLLAVITREDASMAGNFDGLIQGLKLLAVVVVADAVWGMYGRFCQQRLHQALMVMTAVGLLLWPGVATQLLLLVLAAVIASRFASPAAPEKTDASSADAANFSDTNSGDTNAEATTPNAEHSNPATVSIQRRPAYWALGLLLALPLLTYLFGGTLMSIASDFYQAGSLVFGGGHVVLPLLQQSLADTVADDRMLLAYASAQAVPGPMFTMATFLGADMYPTSPLLGALVATIAVFLPGFLWVVALLKGWQQLAERPVIANAVAGLNAAVVGLLLVALYQPVFTSAVTSMAAMAWAIAGFYALRGLQWPLIRLVISFALIGWLGLI